MPEFCSLIKDFSDQNVDKLDLVDINKDNIKETQTLVNRIFPINYSLLFYKEIVYQGKKDFSKLLEVNGSVSGVVICKLGTCESSTPKEMKFWNDDGDVDVKKWLEKFEFKEIPTKLSPKLSKLSVKVKANLDQNEIFQTENSLEPKFIYLSCLGIIAPQRFKGFGEYLMEHVFKLAFTTPDVCCIILHVHTINDEALRFYKRHGFKLVQELPRYYPRLDPESAYLLIWKP